MTTPALRGGGGATVAALLLLGLACAGGLTVRAPASAPVVREGPLSVVPQLRVDVPPARGKASTGKVVGARAPGLGMPGGPIALTERPGVVVHRVVAGELRAAGHRIVSDGQARPEVAVGVWVQEFTVDSPRADSGWDVVARVRFALRVAATPEAEDHTELVYTAERSAHSLVRPSLGTTERVLKDCLADLARLVRERETLARALEAHARRAPVEPAGDAGSGPAASVKPG